MKNIININTLDRITAEENTLYNFNNLLINIYRVKNDINGNPIYKLSILDPEGDNITNKFKGTLGSYYNKGEYIRLQSYNISNSLQNILKIK